MKMIEYIRTLAIEEQLAFLIGKGNFRILEANKKINQTIDELLNFYENGVLTKEHYISDFQPHINRLFFKEEAHNNKELDYLKQFKILKDRL